MSPQSSRRNTHGDLPCDTESPRPSGSFPGREILAGGSRGATWQVADMKGGQEREVSGRSNGGQATPMQTLDTKQDAEIRFLGARMRNFDWAPSGSGFENCASFARVRLFQQPGKYPPQSRGR